MPSNQSMTRRDFVRAAGSVLAAGAALKGAPAVGALGANEKVNLGFIGVGGRGQFHVRQFSRMSDVNIVAVADVSETKRNAAASIVKNRKVLKFKDFRRLLERKDIDAVVVATPDHWHVIPTILACQAGKDVYVEKPLGHNIKEGRAAVRAARKYNRVVQVGLQQRSGPHWIEAINVIRSGKLGKINLVRTWNCWDIRSNGGDMDNPPDSDPPPGVDYDMWLGPAPKRPFNPRRFDFYFYFFWDYSGGMVSAWGVHLFDIVLWAMGPKILSVTTTGGKFVHKDMRDTPDTASVLFECPEYVLTYEMRHGNGNPPWGGMDHGIEFYGTEGSIWINRAGFTFFPEKDRSHPVVVKNQGMDIPHKRNFLECVRTRKRPNADVEFGHLASIPGHLANIAYRVGRRIGWDGANETIPGDTEAQALLGRKYRPPYLLPKV